MSVAISAGLPAERYHISQASSLLAKILEPPPRRDAGEWADANRTLPPDSPEPGPWRTSRIPFWRAIYAAFASDDYDTVVIVCGSQMGKTESLFNVLGHRFTDGPYVPALYIGPTEKNVRSISKDRIDKMLRTTPALWDRTEKGHRYTTYEKWIAGTPLRFGWAGSATELSSHPCGTVLVDERDRMTNDTGDEGDPVELARARTKNYQQAKVGVSSTPTLEGASPVWALLDEGTRHFWAWTCLGCGQVFVPRADLLKWPENCTPDEALTTAAVVCPGCGHRHVSEDQHQLNATGRYIRHRKLEDREKNDRAVWGQYVPDTDARPMRTASFWISGLASPWVTFGQAARTMIQAYRSGEPERIQAVINTWFGELYRVRGEAPAWEEVSACRIEYVPRTIPRGVQKITLGADVQKNGIFWTTRGWGFSSESWLLDEGFLAGETEFEAVWNALHEVIIQPIDARRIDRAFIDSGYRPGDVHRRPDHAVYTFSRRLPGVAFPTKGQDAMDQPFRYANLDYSYGGTVIKNGIRLYHVNTDFFKRWLHARVRWPAEQPGGWHLHNAATEDYCKQIVAEQMLLKASGRVTWVRKSRSNHFLDCFDPSTELLTSDGWLSMPEAVEYAGRFATVNLDSDRIEYQSATDSVARHHDGEMMAIRGRRVDALVTPNHRMVTYRRNPVDNRVAITLAKDLTIWHTMKLTSGWDGLDSQSVTLMEITREGWTGRMEPPRTVDAGDWFEFLGWYVSEGHTRSTGGSRSIIITQNPGPKHDRITALLRRMGFAWRPSSGRQITVTSRQLFNHLADCTDPGEGRGCYRKRVPQLVKDAAPRLIARFVESAVLGDGWQQGGFRTYATTSRLLADDMQELFIKLGHSANIVAVDPGPCVIRGGMGATVTQYHVSETKTKAASLRQSDNTPIFSVVPYSGQVYCVSVPNGTLIARRNGRAFVAGNCEVNATAAAYSLNVHKLPPMSAAPSEAKSDETPSQHRQPTGYQRRGL